LTRYLYCLLYALFGDFYHDCLIFIINYNVSLQAVVCFTFQCRVYLMGGLINNHGLVRCHCC